MSRPAAPTTPRALTRRAFLAGTLAHVGAALFPGGGREVLAGPADAAAAAPGFTPVPPGTGDRPVVPPGYAWHPVVRWGDPLLADAPDFDPGGQTPTAQARQCGFNCDFVGYLPLPRGTGGSRHGLLAVSSEYATPGRMFPDDPRAPHELTRVRAEITMAAHGLNVVEVRRGANGRWRAVPRSPRNRRVSARSPVVLTGPAAGDVRLRTRADPSGRRVVGTLANCSGGLTPWGTWLQAEENVHTYFAAGARGRHRGDRDLGAEIRRGRIRRRSFHGWERHDPRFDLACEPNEVFRFGWVVEVDPYDPTPPVKRTALGRFAHEAATVAVAADGRVAVYSGDDAQFEFLYKYVSHERFVPGDARQGDRLLDAGILHVAHLDEDGTGRWLPLVFGRDPLTPAGGFRNQADVLIRARHAGSAVGATRLDRPEDVQASPTTGHVYVSLTGNPARGAADVDRANPRGPNPHGHLLEIREDGGDAAATTFRWDVFALCGPADAGGTTSPGGFDVLSRPDNLGFDAAGHLWVATDGQRGTVGANDALYVLATSGPARGRARRFLSGVAGAELCSPCFTPDGRTLFLAVQHPSGGFPDYTPGMPPRPSVIAVVREDGGVVGT